MTAALSIVIPALDAAAHLRATLASLRDARADILVREIIVVDGGSQDGTAALAAADGCRVLTSDPGRGVQLAAGACAATGDWLLFLHADTRLEPGWAAAVMAFAALPANAARAGYFRYTLDDDSPPARRLARLVAWRCRALALPYGDQGLLIARSFYEALGGYRPLPLMEDVDLVRRLGRRRLVALDARAVTSAARYRQGGWIARPLRNLSCLLLYFLGLSPRVIRRLYA
ncbi:MAG TPA: TIGR04283 family arsenosugar biosynthesis glycosyltransferase [Alphaproteobacteria bacterium]|nr:TIGR04283 family arsenosugar biosynthesis glycosyltransferase [Alphaproteobacteria bacterium]